MIMEIVQPKRDYLIQKIIIQPELKIVNGIFPFEILVEYVPEILDFMIYYDENKITYKIEIDMYDINKISKELNVSQIFNNVSNKSFQYVISENIYRKIANDVRLNHYLRSLQSLRLSKVVIFEKDKEVKDEYKLYRYDVFNKQISYIGVGKICKLKSEKS
jgi:hypothetical protein